MSGTNTCDYDELPAAKKICLDNEEINNSSENVNQSLQDRTLHLGTLFSPNCSANIKLEDKLNNHNISSSMTEMSLVDISERNSVDGSTLSLDTFFSQSGNNTVDILIDSKNEVSMAKNELVLDVDNFPSTSPKSEIMNSSTQAFDVETVDFMDETCVEGHTLDKTGAKSSSITVNIDTNKKTELRCKEEKGNLDGTTVSLGKNKLINTNKLDDNLDFTCKAEIGAEQTILCEETLILCQSINDINVFVPNEYVDTSLNIVGQAVSRNSLLETDKLSSSRLSCLTNNHQLSECKYDVILNDCSKSSSSIHLLQEVSGSALDYTCSKSISSEHSEITEDMETNKNDVTEFPNTNEKHYECKFNSRLNLCRLKSNNTSIGFDSNHLTNEIHSFSESVASIIPNKCYTTEEVNFFKENLLKVMELLKSDNDNFEAYKLATENERCKLLEKIKNLEAASISCENRLQYSSISEKSDKINSFIGDEQKPITQKEYNNLLGPVIFTETMLKENAQLMNIFQDFNLSVDKFITPFCNKGEFVISIKNLNDLVSLFSEDKKRNYLLTKENDSLIKENKHIQAEMGEMSQKNINLKKIIEDLTITCESLHKSISGKNSNSCSDITEELQLKYVEIATLASNKLFTTDLDEFNKLNSSLTEKLAELQENNETLKAKFINAENDLSKLHLDFDNLKEEHSHCRELGDSNALLEVKVLELNKSINILNQELGPLKDNNDSFLTKNKHIQAEVDELSQQNINLEKVNEDLTLTCESLQKTIGEKNSNCDRLEESNNLLQDEVMSIKIILEESNTKQEGLLKEIEELKVQNAECQNSLIIVEDNYNKVQISCNQITEELQLKNVEIATLASTKQQLTADLDEFNKLNSSLTEKLAELQENYEALKAKCINAENDLSKLHLDFDNLKEEHSHCRELGDSNALLEVKVLELNKGLDILNQELGPLKDQNDSLLTKNKHIQAEVDELSQQNINLEKINEDLTLTCESLQKTIGEKKSNCDRLEESNNLLQNEVMSMKIILEKSYENQEVLQKEIEGLKVQNAECQNSLIIVEDNYNKVQISCNQITEELQLKNVEIATLASTKQQLTADLDEFNKLNSSLTEKFTELQENYEAIKAKCINAENDLSKLHLDFDNLKEEHSHCRELGDSNALLEVKVLELNKGLDILNQELGPLKDQNDSLLTKNKHIQAEVDELSQQNIILEKINEDLTLTCESLQKTIGEKNANCDRLEESNNLLQDEVMSMKIILEVSDKNQEVLQKEIEGLKVQNAECQNSLIIVEDNYNKVQISCNQITEELQLKNVEIATLASTKQQLTADLDEFNKLNSSLTEKFTELQENYEAIKAKCINAENDLSKLHLDFDNLKEEHSHCRELGDSNALLEVKVLELNKGLDILNQELGPLKDENDSLLTKNKHIQAEVDELSQQNINLEKINEDLTLTCESLQKTIGEKNSNCDRLEESNNLLQDEVMSIKIILEESNTKQEGLLKEIEELKVQNAECQNSLIIVEDNYNKVQISCNQITEELQLKNVEIATLASTKQQLTADLDEFNKLNSSLTEKLAELQENYEALKAKCINAENDLSKLHLDFDNLKEEHSHCRELGDSNALLEVKVLELNKGLDILNQELGPLKDENDSLLTKNKHIQAEVDELSQQKINLEKINEDLTLTCESLQKTIGEKNSNCDRLEESNNLLQDEVMSIKIILEESNTKQEGLLKEIEELKVQNAECQNSLIIVEDNYNKVQISCNQITEELQLKNVEIATLASTKQQLTADLDAFNKHNLSLLEQIGKIQEDHGRLENEIVQLNCDLLHANSNARFFDEFVKMIDLLNSKHIIKPDELTYGMNASCTERLQLLSSFIDNVQAMAENLTILEKNYSIEVNKVSCIEEEISKLKKLVDTLTEKLNLANEESNKVQEKLYSISKEHEKLLDITKESTIRCSSLLEKLNGSEVQCNQFKADIDNLKLELRNKEEIIESLSNTKELFDSALKEKDILSFKLNEKMKDHLSTTTNLKHIEEKYISLKVDFDKLTDEVSSSKGKDEVLENKCSEFHKLFIDGKKHIEILQKEKQEIKTDFIKLEEKYQGSIDLLKESKKKICNLEEEYSRNIAALNTALREKENCESQCLSLQSINEESKNYIKELNVKVAEIENRIIKYTELEKYHEIVCNKYAILENQLIDYESLKRENLILKSNAKENESLSNNLTKECDILKEKHSLLLEELNRLMTTFSSFVPENCGSLVALKLIEEKLLSLKQIENDLEEEKTKTEQLDEECNLLNEDLKYKDRVIGDMYKDHATQINELKETLKKEENLHELALLENSTLKDKIDHLDMEISKLKASEPVACPSCAQSKVTIQQLQIDLVDCSSKLTSVQLQTEKSEATYKQKIHEYRKKVSSLQEELGSALNRLDDKKHTKEASSSDASVQTESLPVQISGHSGIVQSVKIKEQDEKIQKMEKENCILKRMCQSRLQTIQQLKTKLETASKPQQTRNVLEEVQNHQT